MMTLAWLVACGLCFCAGFWTGFVTGAPDADEERVPGPDEPTVHRVREWPPPPPEDDTEQDQGRTG